MGTTRARWGLVAFALVGLGAGSLVAAPAVSAASHARAAGAASARRVVAPPGVTRGAVSPNTTGNLTYHHGSVMQKANNAVALFWIPPKLQDGHAAAVDPQYVPLVKRYFGDIGGSALNQIATQYFQVVGGSKQHILNASKFVLADVSTAPYPAAGPQCSGAGPNCLDESHIETFIRSRIAAHPGLPEDLNTEYYVFTDPHESTCYDSSDCFKSDTTSTANFTFCAYHYGFTDPKNGKTVLFANMPYGSIAANGIGCTTLSQFPNNRAADVVISTISHEQLETTTDPTGGGWYYVNNAGEIGDECAYNYGPITLDGGKANEQWNGHFYVVQQEWSNKIHGCSQGIAVP